MKKDIHPTYHSDVQVTCACGNTFATGSTASELKVEICSNCHPFYTGKQKLLDTARRVDKFQKRVEAKTSLEDRKGKTAKRAARKAKQTEEQA